MASIPEDEAQDEELGLSASHGIGWSRYVAFRPIYPKSFFERIYTRQGWGCSATLVTSFTNVIVSNPNEDYTKPRQILVGKLGTPKSRFSFLQGSAEKSTVQSSSICLITTCEMIQWTDTAAAVEEFYRQLKSAGLTWLKFFVESTKRTVGHGYFYDHAYETINSGFESIELLETKWEVVNRIYANTGESLDAFHINDLVRGSKVKEVEEKTWEESDEEWSDVQGIDWFKGYFATWVPRIPETEIQSLWDELELAMNGERSR
ncbi:hypothetical protein SCUP234_04966 [Seiridium cupressi]